MTNRRARQITLALLLAATTMTTGALAFAGGPQIGTATHGSINPNECRYARWDGRHGVTDTEVRKMVRCAVRRWPVEGGLTKAYAVIRCESGFDEGAYNASSGAGGIYQFLASTWDSARRRYHQLGQRLELSLSRFNARASAIVGTRYASEGGWGPWGCA